MGNKNGWLKENAQKPSEMMEKEAKTDIDERKLTSKPDFPTLLIKNVYEL